MNKCIILVGVGGQGTITTSTILSKGLIEAGFDVKMSEIHGMSQRGGTVVTQIKYGEKVYSPIIGDGEADIIVSFEKLEALRTTCREVLSTFLKQLSEAAQACLDVLQQASVPPEESNRGFLKALYNYLDPKAPIKKPSVYN